MDDEYKVAHPEWVDFFEQNQIPILGNVFQKGRTTEKEVVMTLFDSDGNSILKQNCGFRVFGEMSRMKNQPSFRLYARSEYDEQEDFNYVLFDNEYTLDNTLVNNFNHITVRNSGNDNGYAFIRSEASTRIAEEAGFPDSSSAIPVCAYINGEYYGVYWFITSFDDKYFRHKYGDYDGVMFVFEGELSALELPNEQENNIYRKLGEEYNQQQEFFANVDLTDEDNWERINEFLDVENFLQYMAIENYLSNEDSLNHNYKVYRYYSPDGKYTSNSMFDGKYRFLLYDLDFSLGLIEEYSWKEPETLMLTTERISGDTANTKLFANLLKREDCKRIYIKYFLSLLNYYYCEEQVMETVTEMHEERWAELQYMIEHSEFLVNNFFAPDILDTQHVSEELHRIRLYSQNRLGYAMSDLNSAFGSMTIYTLTLSNPNNASVTLDYATFDKNEFVGN